MLKWTDLILFQLSRDLLWLWGHKREVNKMLWWPLIRIRKIMLVLNRLLALIHNQVVIWNLKIQIRLMKPLILLKMYLRLDSVILLQWSINTKLFYLAVLLAILVNIPWQERLSYSICCLELGLNLTVSFDLLLIFKNSVQQSK